MDIHLISKVGCAVDALFELKKTIPMTVLLNPPLCFLLEGWVRLDFFLHFRQMTSEKVKISLVTQDLEDTG